MAFLFKLERRDRISLLGFVLESAKQASARTLCARTAFIGVTGLAC
jgi:hypothetical protein